MLDLTPTFTTFPILETERTILRAPTDDDASDLFALWCDPHVVRYVGRLPMTTLDEARQRLNLFQTNYEQRIAIVWAITNRADGRAIGTTTLLRMQLPHFRTEIGYELSLDHWGKGLIPEVASAVLDYAFSVGFHSIEARTDAANTNSQRVLEKLGFVQEGYFHENYYEPAVDRFTDTAIFSLLKSVWMSRKTA
jgi:[ribosomal protein S5]-alanine N-acetyltransferase